MSASQKQLNANRANAQKSTGPKTKSGKAASSRNAVTHGLYSKDLIINSPYLKEDSSQYNNLLNSLFDDLKPKGMFQQQLVLKIANSLWRSRRIVKAETAQINRQLDDISLHRSFMEILGPDQDETEDQFDDHDDSDGILDEIEDDPDDIEDDDPDNIASETDNLIGIKSIPNDTFSRNILRYEMRLDRQLTRAYRLLQHLQNKKRRKPSRSQSVTPRKGSKRP